MRRTSVHAALTVALLAALLGPVAGRASVEVDEEEVVFRFPPPGGERIFLVGDFNGWNPTMDRLIERDGAFELRLFLLPGMYRYRFIVDGASLPDPGNPNRDVDGNSFFILRESDGRYEIVFEKPYEGVRGVEDVEAAFTGEGVVTAVEGAGTAFLRGSADLVIDERVEAGLSVACEYTVAEGSNPAGRSFVLAGSAAYRLDNGTVTAFSRDGLLDLGDPLGTFGAVGPYDYPIGLFCRGIRYEGDIARFVRSRVIYASRIDGDMTGPGQPSSDGPPLAHTDPTDSDMIGVAVGRRIGRFELYYLYRRDHRPKEGSWRPGGPGATVYRGYEKTRVTGVWTTVSGPEGLSLQAEYLDGKSILAAREREVPGAGAFEPFEQDRRWENGRRFLLGLTLRRELIDARALLFGTTIEGLSAVRGERPDGGSTVLRTDAGIRVGELTCGGGAAAEMYSAGNTGALFWLQRYNFWLDGDRLTVGRLPFLTSRNVQEVYLRIGWREVGDEHDPYGTGLRLSLMRRMDGNDSRRHVTELVFREGLPIGSRLTHILDIRYVSYGHEAWRGERQFTDFFTALHVKINPSAWVSIGAGVNPYAFDRWRYRFTGYGRERYLIERGVLDSVADAGEQEVLRALEMAEETLSGEWSFVVEAQVRF